MDFPSYFQKNYLTGVGYISWQNNSEKPNTSEYAQVFVVTMLLTCWKLKSEKCPITHPLCIRADLPFCELLLHVHNYHFPFPFSEQVKVDMTKTNKQSIQEETATENYLRRHYPRLFFSFWT